MVEAHEHDALNELFTDTYRFRQLAPTVIHYVFMEDKYTTV